MIELSLTDGHSDGLAVIFGAFDWPVRKKYKRKGFGIRVYAIFSFGPLVRFPFTDSIGGIF